jgi:phospholipid/cholesterol/gamma-HCH transport system ATP-binding protein
MTTQVMSPIVQFEQVGISFGAATIHRDISFSVQSGESITLLGPSGIGKTLILKMLIGLLRPTTGSITVLGHPIHSLSEANLREVRQDFGMLFQGAALFDSLSVFENVAYALRERKQHSDDEIAGIVQEKLDWIGLPDISSKFPSELSGGQKKRVGLARALVSKPKVLVFDEPTTGLDPTATRLIDELIIKLNKEQGVTCVSVTHDIASARRISNRWLLVNRGTIVADGSPNEVLEQSAAVRDFISGNWQDEMRCAS